MSATFLEMLQQGQDNVKVSTFVGGRKTSFSVERVFRDELTSIAKERGISRDALVRHLAEYTPYLSGPGGLSRIIRLFVVSELRRKAAGGETR